MLFVVSISDFHFNLPKVTGPAVRSYFLIDEYNIINIILKFIQNRTYSEFRNNNSTPQVHNTQITESLGYFASQT